jgi:predicted Zn-dependent protease
MKRYFYAFALLLLATGCVKVIAGEEERIDVSALHNKRFGASARDFLSSEQYTSLKIEVQYMAGYKPDEQALRNLHLFLARYLNKPAGIFINTKEIDAVADTVMNHQDLVALERRTRSEYTHKNTLAVHLVYTNGEYVNPRILGLAYQNTSAVIFGKMIQKHSGRIGQPDRTKLETTVLLHEMGHLLGLINKGTDMQSDHKDDDHESHCSNKDCLMYYSIGTQDRFGYLVRGNIPALDAHCERDLKANGGR